MKKTIRAAALFLALMISLSALVTGVSAGRECDYHAGRNVVAYDVVDGAGKVYCFAEEDKYIDGVVRDERLYFCTNSDHGVFNPSYIGNCVLEADICALSADAYMDKWAYDGFITFDMAQSKIGVGGVEISLNSPWSVGEWHHVAVYSFYGDIGSVMAVDGQLLSANSSCVLGSDAVVGRFWCVGCHNIAIDNIAVYESAGANLAHGDLIYFEDFEDGLWQMCDPNYGVPGPSPNSGGYIVDYSGSSGSTHYEHDLGSYYWFWDPSHQYNLFYGLNGNYAKWEFDVKVPAQNVDSRSYNGNDPIFGDGVIGVGSTTLSYTWDGDWHHVVMDGEDGTGTEIWVDGYRIGKVSTAIKAYWVGKPGNDVGIDNLKVTGNGNNYFEDFEDRNFAGISSDSNGFSAEYYFPHPHDAAAVTPPTCTTQGYTTYTCTICGDSYNDDYTPPLGHSYGEWVVVTAPSANANGLKRRTCIRCDAFEEETISVLTDPVMTVGTASGQRGDTVTVDVRLTNNPGIYAQNFVIYYPKTLTLTSAAASGDVYPADSAASSSSLAIDPASNAMMASYFADAGVSYGDVYAMVWYVDNGGGFVNSTENGKILTLTFTIPSGGDETTHPVGIFGVYAPTDDAVDRYGDSISSGVVYVNGSVTVAAQPAVRLGDVNDDGVVNMMDVRSLKRYLAGAVPAEIIVFANSDMNGDGAVNVQDLKILKQFIAG